MIMKRTFKLAVQVMGDMSAAEKKSNVSMDTDDENAPLTPEEKRLRWKIDLRIIPYLAPLYLLFNLDRANIAYARLYGIEKALDLTPDQYSMSLAIFHIGND
ncbi:hypothetical protein DSO57_1008814 [Entomophthora muscae]|uniref:Uncharacterized protein n=1 Tax=Entomophthora muscae TaxID=34485 RepID=A0ACC2USY0_9FUNG|nr:hypothetical protein DSO57_1008814 [Entomophthora muscae]